MVRCWYHDNKEDVPSCEPHMLVPGEFLGLKEVADMTGLEYFQFDADSVDTNKDFLQLKKDRGYACEDQVQLNKETMPNFDEKMKIFYTEHLHSDEEIRFVSDGSGYFDLRSRDDKWIRIEVSKNDLLIVPSGIYHRFTLDAGGYIKARRLFTEAPSWTPINRPEADTHPLRQEYLRKMGVLAS